MTKKASKGPTKVTFSEQLGKTFRRRRIELGLSLDQVVAETRIGKHYLKSLEAGHYETLPATIHSVGFVRRLAKLLELDSTTATAKFIAERGPLPTAKSLRRQTPQTTVIGSRLFTWVAITLVMIGIVGYLVWQISVLAAPPRLSVNQPVDDLAVTSQSLPVMGLTTPGAEVVVNGQYIYVNDDGQFTTTVTLVEGLNTITISATNSRDKSTTLERSVLYLPDR